MSFPEIDLNQEQESLRQKIDHRLSTIRFAAGRLGEMLAGAEIPPTHEIRLSRRLAEVVEALKEMVESTKVLRESR